MKLLKTILRSLGIGKIIRKNPKIDAAARVLFTSPAYGKYYLGASPHLRFTSSFSELLHKFINEYSNHHPGTRIRLLDVGGGSGRREVRNLVKEEDYFLLDTDPKVRHLDDNIIVGDICDCPQIDDNSFDIIHSNNVFEHISEPWKACQEIGRILRPGGLCFTSTVFSWRYHPVPEDYWRFSHSGLKIIFEKYGNLETLECGYRIPDRRMNFAGGKIDGNLDGVPVDGYGGWLEGWIVLHIGKKSETGSPGGEGCSSKNP